MLISGHHLHLKLSYGFGMKDDVDEVNILTILYSLGPQPHPRIWVLIVSVSRECSDKPVHMHSLARAFVSRIHKVWK